MRLDTVRALNGLLVAMRVSSAVLYTTSSPFDE